VILSGWGSARRHGPRPVGSPLRRLAGRALVARLLVAALVALIPVLAGCEAGADAPTQGFHYPTDAAGTVVGALSIRNVFVLGAPLGSNLHPGQSASLFFAIVNTGQPDRLLGIAAPGTATAVKLPGGTVPVLPMKPVLFVGPKAQAYLIGLTRMLASGSNISLVLDFQKAGLVTLQVPVMPWASHYVTYSPPPSPAPTSTKALTHHVATPTPSPAT
jgi:copper(I)-binding protein